MKIPNIVPAGKTLKERQKTVRLYEIANYHLKKLSEYFKMSESDYINIFLLAEGKKKELIDECEEILKNPDKNLVTIIVEPKFLGFYHISNQYGLIEPKFAYEYVKIFISKSIDKNYKYFIQYSRQINILEAPNSLQPLQTIFFNESKSVDILMREFENLKFDPSTWKIDKNSL